MNILVIEDHLDWRDMMIEHLSGHGLSVRAGGTLREMKDALQEQMPNILILDPTLPDGNALPELADLRQRFPAMGIVVVTGRIQLQDRVRSLGNGADYYLTKPLKLPELSATLTALSRRLRTGHGTAAPVKASWKFDRKTGNLTGPEGITLTFTDRESRIFSALLESPHFPISNTRLLQTLGVLSDRLDTHRVDALVYRIRQKLRALPGVPIGIRNIYSEGYICTHTNAIDFVQIAE